MGNRRFLSLFGLLLIAYISVHAQRHFVYTPIDCISGLSENGVRNILQLEDGRMVFTTEGVTNIYDGTTFKHIHLKGSDRMLLSGYSGYHHGYVDKDYFWMKHLGKLMVMDIKLERFVPRPDSVLATMGVREPIADFFVDTDKNYWILTSGDQLLFRKSGEQKSTVFLQNVSSLNGLADELYDIAVVQGQFFLCYRSGLMVAYDLNSKRELYQTNPFKELPSQFGRTLMVVASKNVLYQIRNGQGGIMLAFDLLRQKWSTVLQTDYWLNTLTIDNEDNLWVSCQKGLWFMDKDLKQKQFISSFKVLDGTEITTEISSQYHDSQGGLWIGTINRGLLYYHTDRFKFRNLGPSDFASGVKNINVNGFAFNPSQGIIVGTSCGLFTYSLETNGLSLVPGIPANVDCISFSKDRSGRIWICTQNQGLYCLQKAGFQHFVPLNELIFQISETPDGQLFAATNRGFGKFNPSTGTVELIISGGLISQVISLGTDAILGAGNSGLFIYDYKKRQFDQTLNSLLQTGNQQYNCLFEDSAGRVWIGTQDGLSVWNPGNKKIRTLYTDEGLVNNSIKGIEEDKQGRIWVTTSGGISRITVSATEKQLQFSFANFNHFDGVLGNEFLSRSTFISNDGLLLMGGINGFNAIDLQKPWRFTELPKPLFTNLMLFGSKLKQGQSYNGNTVLKNSISSTDQVELKYNQNFISVEFSALNYVNPTLTYFRYRLEGVDEDWRELVAQNGTGAASYTSLAPGTYQLKVMAANNSKKWTEKIATLTIEVKAPFWKTPLAYFIYLLLALLMLYSVMNYYKRWAQQKLVRKNEEKLNQMKFNFFTNISHEFRTPLTLIITPLESILKEVKDTVLASKLRNIFINARDLQGLVNQLLDFRRLEMSGEKLNLTFGNIVEFVQQFDGLFAKLAQEKQIDFATNTDLPDIFIYFDQSKLYRILNNLLSNAFKFTPPCGQISLKLTIIEEKSQQRFIQIDITDSGKGIAETDLPHIFNRFYQPLGTEEGSGIGLHLVKEYVNMHFGDITVKSEQNKETCFTLKIPMNLMPKNSEIEASAAVHEEMGVPKFVTSSGKKYKLLVVEDNNDLRRFIVSELSKNYEILEAADGIAGKELANTASPDLIISDVLMPNMSGLELCHSIKSDVNTSHIPVILLTALTSEEHQLQGYKSGADEYLTKPFNLDILLLRIAKLIEQQSLRKKHFAQKLEVNPKDITITSFDEKLIQKALECIEKNMDNPAYSVKQFSEDMGMDRTVLYKKLLSITDLPPSEFIRSIRLKRAAQLLLKSQLSVGEVADKVGFNTHRYFSKYFKEAYGVTPSEFIKDKSGRA